MHVTLEHLDSIILSGRRHVRIAEDLLVLAEQVDAGSSVNRADLLVAAADQHGSLETPSAAWSCAGRPFSTADPCLRTPGATWSLPCWTQDGRTRRSRTSRPYDSRATTCTSTTFLGETLEGAERYLEAIEVFATGLHGPETGGFDRSMLLHGRRRCREALGLAADAADQRALAALPSPEPPIDREVDLVGFVPAWVGHGRRP